MASTPPHSRKASDAERLRLFIDGVTDYAIYMLAPDGTISSWNAGAERFKQYEADEIIGRHFSLFYTEEERSSGGPDKTLTVARQTGKFEGEGWRVRKDGSRFWASVVVDAIYDEQGTLAGYAKITRDITERKQTQIAYQASEEKFRLLVQGVTDYAIYMLSPLGEVTNWNAGAERIKGYTADEVIGLHFSRFYTDDDRLAGLPAKALGIAQKNGRFEGEGWRVRKDGSRFFAHVVLDAIRDEMGVLLGFAKITRDITERQQAAEALERAKEALFQSQKLEAIGKLTGGIAHDFNNLLGVMISGLEILSQESQTVTSRKMIDSMERAATRGAALIQQLLLFSRRQQLSQERHNLNQVIQSFEPVLRRAVPSLISLDFQLDRALHAVMTNAAQFEAALLNTVVNARDAMPDGGRITIETANIDADRSSRIKQLQSGQYVCVAIKDSGTGMPPEVVARAIEPFFTTKSVGKGTGMGLSQVYGLVQQSNGSMTIDTVPGQGTVISLYFPALSLEDCAGESSPAENRHRDKALVVDDEPAVLEMAATLFRSMGYEVLAANSGAEALSILGRTPDIDVVFTDVVMPGMSGIELGIEVRKRKPDTRVILASGYTAMGGDAGHAMLKDFAFLNKPYRAAEIMRLLRTAEQQPGAF